jgi:hypothetical protein
VADGNEMIEMHEGEIVFELCGVQSTPTFYHFPVRGQPPKLFLRSHPKNRLDPPVISVGQVGCIQVTSYQTSSFAAEPLGPPAGPQACDADWASHGGHCYKYFPVQLNYHDAESKCAEEGASVVHIANADENAFVGTLLPQAEKSWVWTSNPVDVDKYHNYWPGRRECIRFFSWVWFTNEDASDEGCFKNTPDSSQQASYVCEKEAPTDFCDYPLILIVGVPHDDAGYTASIFSDIRKYLKARVKTHLKCNPNGWIGIEKFANAQWLACPMSSDADELLNCIDGIPSARMHSLPHAGFSMPQDTKENSIGLMPAVAHALTAVEHWYFYELDRIRFPDVLDLWVMEVVLPGPSSKPPMSEGFGPKLYDPVDLWFTYDIYPSNYGVIDGGRLGVNVGLDPLEEFKTTTVDVNFGSMWRPIWFTSTFDPVDHSWHVSNPTLLEQYGFAQILTCRHHCDNDDCPGNDVKGRYVTFVCPYLSTLMEHCYKCHGGSWVTTDEWQPDEVVICDGWTQEIIERQCNTPHYIEACFKHGTTYSIAGVDPIQAKSALDCQQQCFAQDGCNYFTYSEDEASLPNACWLLEHIGGVSEKSHFISGDKECADGSSLP